MAISEFEIFKVEKTAKNFCDDRNKHYPPDQLYIDFRLENQTLFIMEIRPRWNDPTKITKQTVAKLWYVKKDQVWKLYWQRQNMSWLLYEENGVNEKLEPLLQIIWDDSHGCFWG